MTKGRTKMIDKEKTKARIIELLMNHGYQANIYVVDDLYDYIQALAGKEYERGRQDVVTETGGAVGSELKNRWEREAVEGLKDWYARGVEVPDLIGGYTVKEKFLSMLEIDIDFYLKERRNKNDR